MIITVFKEATGRIDRTLRADVDEGFFELNLHGGEDWIEGEWSGIEYRIVDREPVPIPPRPDPHHVFDYELGEWIDPRTAADLSAELQARREAAFLAKSDLLITLASHEIIGWEEAALASAGQIPPSLVPMMEALPPEAQDAAKIKWNADGEISRMHPVIQAAAYALGLSDELVDQIFGVEAE